jgi:hypothetical protein
MIFGQLSQLMLVRKNDLCDKRVENNLFLFTTFSSFRELVELVSCCRKHFV